MTPLDQFGIGFLLGMILGWLIHRNAIRRLDTLDSLLEDKHVDFISKRNETKAQPCVSQESEDPKQYGHG